MSRSRRWCGSRTWTTSKAFQSSNSSLESCIVVQSDLIGDVVGPVIHIGVPFIAGTSHQSSIQLMRIVLGGVSKGVPCALSWGAGTGGCLVMRLLGIVVTKPNHITSSTVSKHVSNLLVSIGCVFSSFDSSISSLKLTFLYTLKNIKNRLYYVLLPPNRWKQSWKHIC